MIAPANPNKKNWLYGKAVVNGEPRFLSVSRLSGADEAEGGCLRAWWYEMVGGRKRPPTRASTRGDNLHAEIEKYLKTGDRSLSSLALSGLHMVPDPGPDLLVEHDLLRRPRDPEPSNEAEAAALLARAPLTADGIPVLGRMDLIHGRGTNKGGSSIEDVQDPPGTVEVMDWKSTGSPDYIKQARQLPKLIQMAGYGEWVFRVEPGASAVRLSHGYFVERGGPSRKVTLRVLREDVARTWEHAEVVARRIRHAAREIDPDKVDANLGACDRYGGCHHREICKARMHQALVSFVGQTAAEKLLGKHGEQQMGLVDTMKNKARDVATTPAGLPDLGLAAPAAPAGPTPEQIAAEKAKLEAEERAQREIAQLRAAVEKFSPLLSKIEGYSAANKEIDLGMPAFAGEGAKLYYATKGMPMGVDIAGAGKLAGQVVTGVEAAEKLASGLDQYLTAGQIKPAASSAPAPLAGLGGLLSSETPAPQAPPTEAPIAPPSSAVTVPASTAPASGVNPAAGGGEPKAEEKAADKAAKPKAPKAEKAKPAPTGTTINVFVDAIAEGVQLTSLHPLIEQKLAELAAAGSDSDLRAPGVRQTADGKLVFEKDSSPYTFGKGDGAIGAVFREFAIEPGFYCVHTRGNRLYEIVADALRVQCQKTGGLFVWGTR